MIGAAPPEAINAIEKFDYNVNELRISINAAETKTLPAKSSVKLKVISDLAGHPFTGDLLITARGEVPILSALTKMDKHGQSYVIAINTSDFPMKIPRGEFIGLADRIDNLAMLEYGENMTETEHEEIAAFCNPQQQQEEMNIYNANGGHPVITPNVPKPKVNKCPQSDQHEIACLCQIDAEGEEENMLENPIFAGGRPRNMPKQTGGPIPVHLNTKTPISDEERWERLRQQIDLKHLPADEKEKYLELISEYKDVFSVHKYELGRTGVVKHNIRLDTEYPLHNSQFRIPEEHHEPINRYVDELKRAGCIEVSNSPYNSSIFLVRKKDGSPRVVLDYRHINWHSMQDKYVIRDVRECIDTVGKARSEIFSTMDITSSFWQLELEEAARQFTAFTIPGVGRYQWNTTPMGLHGSTSSFSRMMDQVMSGIKGTITYIDDLL